MSGLLATGSRHLGQSSVSGYIREPRPAARITARQFCMALTVLISAHFGVSSRWQDEEYCVALARETGEVLHGCILMTLKRGKRVFWCRCTRPIGRGSNGLPQPSLHDVFTYSIFLTTNGSCLIGEVRLCTVCCCCVSCAIHVRTAM